MNELNLYRIFFSDGNDKNELGRVTSKNIEEAEKYAISQYLNNSIPENELISMRDGDGENSIYLMLNVCLDCPYYDKTDKQKQKIYVEYNSESINLDDIDDICEHCEQSSYMEIRQDNESESEFKTIFGVNEYANIEENIKPKPYNETLVKAWSIDPQIGITELMHQTINDNPKLCDSIDFEFLKRINKNHEELTKKGDNEE